MEFTLHEIYTRTKYKKKNNNNVQINIELSIPHAHIPVFMSYTLFSLFLTYYTTIDQIIKPK